MKSDRSISRLRRTIAGLLLVGVGGCASSATTMDAAWSVDQREALATVQALFDAMAAHDAAAAERVLLVDGTLYSVSRDANGPRVERATWREFLASLAAESGKARGFHEQFVGAPTVLVDGDVAVVWGAYRFDLDGVPHHCGIDAMTLVRTVDGWRIAVGADTRVSR